MMNEKKTILLVEDEPALLEVAGQALQKYFHVCAASNGLEALERLKGDEVDCIVLDIDMPGMDGIEFLRSLRGSGDYTPVIITTGQSCQEYAEEAADLMIHGYIIKPYQPSQLAERISHAIAHRGMGGKSNRRNDNSKSKLDKVLDYLGKNYSTQINALALSKEAGLSYGHMAELFKLEFEMNFTCYLNRLRVGKAKKLIKNTELPLFDIMEKTGFNTEQHFYKQFKRFTGTTPKSLRKSIETIEKNNKSENS